MNNFDKDKIKYTVTRRKNVDYTPTNLSLEKENSSRGNDLEKQILEITAELWNKYLELPDRSKDDDTEFRHCLHNLQNQIYARAGIRVLGNSKKYE